MRNLTSKEIETLLVRFKKAKRIAVENFLMTVANNGNAMNAFANEEMDARLYNWNADTRKAIQRGIQLSYKLTTTPYRVDLR